MNVDELHPVLAGQDADLTHPVVFVDVEEPARQPDVRRSFLGVLETRTIAPVNAASPIRPDDTMPHDSTMRTGKTTGAPL